MANFKNNNFKQYSQKQFFEDPNAAVFLTGLKSITDHREYMNYRNQVYECIKDWGLYIRKFDYPKGKSNAYLHLKDANQTDFLLKKKSLNIDGRRISIYRYQKSMARKYQESRNESNATSYAGSSYSTRPSTPNNESLFKFDQSTGYNSQANYSVPDEESKQSNYKNIKKLYASAEFQGGMNAIKQISIKQKLEEDQFSSMNTGLTLPVVDDAPVNSIEINDNDSSDNDSLLNVDFDRQDTIKASNDITNDEADAEKARIAVLENAEYIYTIIQPHLHDISWCSNIDEAIAGIKNEAIKLALTKINGHATISQTDLVEIINSINNVILEIATNQYIAIYNEQMNQSNVF